MPRTGRPKAALVLSEDEREQLGRWSRRARASQALGLRSRIVLACAEGADNKAAAARLGCAEATVGKWRRRFVADRLGGVGGQPRAGGPRRTPHRQGRRRFVADRLDGLVDEPRPGAPRSITDEQVEQVLVATLERTPRDATHWSRASMAVESGLSESTVGRIWRAFGLRPGPGGRL